MSASASYHFDAQASLVKKNIAASGTTTATLDDTTGVSSVLWTVVAAYGSVPADWSLSSTTGTSTVVTAPSGTAKSCLLQCKVNGGVQVDPVTGRQTAGGETIRTAKIYISPETIVTGETTESDATNGWSPLVNAAIVATGGTSALTGTSLVVTDSDTSLQIHRSAPNKASLTAGAGDSIRIDSAGNVELDVTASGTVVFSEADIAKLTTTVNNALNHNYASGVTAKWQTNGSDVAKLDSTGWHHLAAVADASAISPAALAASQNDYSPTGLGTCNTIRQDASANVSITGLLGGYTGRMIRLINISAANTITLTHDDALSTAANRFALPSGASIVIPVGGCVGIWYDATSTRWRPMSKTF